MGNSRRPNALLVLGVLGILGIFGPTAGCKKEDPVAEATNKVQEAMKQLQAASQQAAAQGAAKAQGLAQAAAEAAAQNAQAAAQGAKNAAQGGAESAAAGMAAGAQAMADATKQMQQAIAGAAGAKVELIPFRELKALLPESLSGMKRTEATGEKAAVMGMGASHAKGRYQGEGGARISIKITDIGGTGLLAMAQAGWAAAEIDRETDHGYERTSTIDGRKAFEKYDTQNKRGEVKVLTDGRFIVEVDGHGVEMGALKDALGKIDLGKLSGLKAK